MITVWKKSRERKKKVSDNKFSWKVIKLLETKSIMCERANQYGRKRGNFKKGFKGSRSFKYFLWKYNNHPNISAGQNKYKNRIKFGFEEIDLAIIAKEVHNLKVNTASQSSDISTKIVKENINVFAEFLWKQM